MLVLPGLILYWTVFCGDAAFCNHKLFCLPDTTNRNYFQDLQDVSMRNESFITLLLLYIMQQVVEGRAEKRQKSKGHTVAELLVQIIHMTRIFIDSMETFTLDTKFLPASFFFFKYTIKQSEKACWQLHQSRQLCKSPFYTSLKLYTAITTQSTRAVLTREKKIPVTTMSHRVWWTAANELDADDAM